MRADLQALLERVEKAEGPDEEVDMQLCLLAYPEIMAVSEKRDDGFWYHKQWGRMSVPANYTASIDAAVALVEKMLPGWTGHLDFGGSQACAYAIRPLTEGPLVEHRAFATTPALALIAALLRALIAQEKA